MIFPGKILNSQGQAVAGCYGEATSIGMTTSNSPKEEWVYSIDTARLDHHKGDRTKAMGKEVFNAKSKNMANYTNAASL